MKNIMNDHELKALLLDAGYSVTAADGSSYTYQDLSRQERMVVRAIAKKARKP